MYSLKGRRQDPQPAPGPGPGAYSVAQPLGSDAPSALITPRPEYAAGSDAPGPGTYEHGSMDNEKKGFTMLSRRPNELPSGPGIFFSLHQ